MALGQEGLFGLVSMTVQHLLADIDSEVSGTIYLSENRRHSSRYGWTGVDRYHIRYFYFVEDKTYNGDIIKYELSTEFVEERLRSYQEGQTVRVIYDSSIPSWSLLEDGNMSKRMIYQIILTFVVWPVLVCGIVCGLGRLIFHD